MYTRLGDINYNFYGIHKILEESYSAPIGSTFCEFGEYTNQDLHYYGGKPML